MSRYQSNYHWAKRLYVTFRAKMQQSAPAQANICRIHTIDILPAIQRVLIVTHPVERLLNIAAAIAGSI